MSAGNDQISAQVRLLDPGELRYNIFGTDLSGGLEMANTYTAILKQDGDWWIGWIEEVPGVNCQEKTREELLESLSVTLKEALELNREEAIREAAPDYTEEPLIV
jgi:predicted RNase H-like HicB family nuclease